MASFIDTIFAGCRSRSRSSSLSATRKKSKNKNIKPLRLRESIEPLEVVLAEPKKTPLLTNLKQMIEYDEQTDCVICIGNEHFHCHMNVLQSFSDIFTSITTEIFVSLPPQKVTPDAFRLIYEWMKTDKPQVQREGILQLFEAAVFLQIRSLVRQIWTCFDNDRYLVEANAFTLFLEAQTLPRTENMLMIKCLMLGRVYKFFQILMTTPEFIDLELVNVCQLLSCNTIGVHSEIEVFLAAVRWLHLNKIYKARQISEVMCCVRFNALPAWFLVLLSNIECDIIRPYTLQKDVVKKIKDGLTYNTTLLYYGDDRKAFLSLIERYGLKMPTARRLLKQNKYDFYEKFEKSVMHKLTYQLYFEYLKEIQLIANEYFKALTFVNEGKDPLEGR